MKQQSVTYKHNMHVVAILTLLWLALPAHGRDDVTAPIFAPFQAQDATHVMVPSGVGAGKSRAVAAILATPVSPVALFDLQALVKPITEMEGTLSDGSKATVYKIVVRSLPDDHETGPLAPKTIKDMSGYWEDTIDKKLHRMEGDYLKSSIIRHCICSFF